MLHSAENKNKRCSFTCLTGRCLRQKSLYIDYMFTASATGRLIEFLVPAKDRITVRNGDLLGWYNTHILPINVMFGLGTINVHD